MRKCLAFTVVFAVLLFALGAMAQATAPDTSGQSNTPSTDSGQNSMGNSQNSMGSGMQDQASSGTSGPASVEGCVVKEEQDYYLIPQSGNPIHLSSNSTANPASHVGEHVTAKGTATPMGNNSTSSGTSSSGNNLASAANQDMQVVEIDTVEESCPSAWNPQWNKSGTGANPTK